MIMASGRQGEGVARPPARARSELGVRGRAVVTGIGLCIPRRCSTLNESPDVGMSLNAAEERPARGVLP